MADDRPALLLSVGGTRGRPDLAFGHAVLGRDPRRCYVLGTREREVVCEAWSLETGERLTRTVLDEGDHEPVSSWITDDPDRVRVHVRGSAEQRVGLLDLRAATIAWEAALPPDAYLLHVSRDGRTWVVHGWPGYNNELALVVDGRSVRALPFSHFWATSRDGRTVAGWERDAGSILLLDAGTGADLAAFAAERAELGLVGLDFAADGATLWGLTYDEQLVAWSVDAGALRAWWALGHEATLLAVSRDGRAALLDDGRAFALGVAEPVDPCAFSWSPCVANMAPDGRGWVTYGGVLRWNELGAGRPTDLVDEGHVGEVRGFATTADGATLASCGDDPAIHVRDVATGALRWALEGYATSWDVVAFAPDGRTLFAAPWREWMGCAAWDVTTGGEIDPRHPETGAPLTKYGVPDELTPADRLAAERADWTLPDTDERPRRACWSADGRHLLCVERIDGGIAARIYRYDASLELRRRVELRLFSPQLSTAMGSRLCAFGSASGQVAVLDHTTGACVELLPRRHASVTALHFSPDESRLLVGSSDGLVRVFRT